MNVSDRRNDAPVLDVRGARKQYSGGALALDGVDLQLSRGEWLGLLGPNGAGKTTLVKAIAGRVRLDAGSVELLGRSISAAEGRGQLRSSLGVVPQEVAIYPLLTARENLEVFGSLSQLNGKALKEAVQWGLEFAGLSERARDSVKSFSGGMKRRLNIAASVMHRPEVILLDEPTVGVDPQSRERIWTMLAQLQSDGASLLLTSHQLDEVERVCERIVIIDHGRVIADGSIDALVTQTIGPGRRVTIITDRPLEAAAQSSFAGFDFDGPSLSGMMDDVGSRLISVLNQVTNSGCSVMDIHIEKPTLQAVFIHLTGRELRE